MATIEKRGDSYRITVSVGYDIDGKQIRKKTTWKPEPGMSEKQIKKALTAHAVKFEENCKSGAYVDDSIRFIDFTDQWMDYMKNYRRKNTIDGYERLLKRINPAIGHVRLGKLKPHHLITFYTNLQEKGVREDDRRRCKEDLKARLKSLSMTKTAFAEKAGISITVLNAIDKGKNVSAQSAAKISAAFGVKETELFEVVKKADTLSLNTVKHYHRLISSILSTAVQWQIIPSNPCASVRLPTEAQNGPDSKDNFLDEKEAVEMLKLLESEDIRFRTIVYLLMYTGLRRGELCGLDWGDINFDNYTIEVNKTSNYLPREGVFEDTTKNKTSRRSIKVPKAAIDMLRSYKAWQSEQRLIMGDKWQGSNRLFTTQDGRPVHPTTVTSWFRTFVEKHNFKSITARGLRHTNATLQIAGGVDIRTVAGRLGHANTSTTTDIYSHFIRSANEAAADVLEDILTPRKGAK